MYTVIKRDGKIIDFEIEKIAKAISMAFDAVDKEYNQNIIDFLALKVTADFEPKIKDPLSNYYYFINLGNAQSASIIPLNKDAPDIIYTSHRSQCSKRRRLYIVHLL